MEGELREKGDRVEGNRGEEEWREKGDRGEGEGREG